MYGSVVWGIVQGACAQYALATCSLTNLAHCRWERLARFPSCEGPAAVSAGSRRSLDLETHGRRDGWPGHGLHWSPTGQSSRRGNCDYRATGGGIDFVKGLGADVVVDYHEQNISIPWAVTLWTSSSTTWVSQACGNCRGRSGSLSGFLQIVTSAVRADVALTLSRRRSLFASAKFVFVWNTGCFSSTLMHRVLCAAGACSLSVPWWLHQFTAPLKRTTAFSGLMRLRSSSCTTSSIVTNRSRDSSVEVRLDLGTSVGRITDCNCDDDRDRR